jgi:hypothetical protein
VTSKVILGITVGLLLFSLGCGSTGAVIPITGNFGNSSLKGNYQYQISGIGLDVNGNNNYYAEAGVFVADGNGKITSGTDDFNQLNSGSPAVSNPLTGTYTIGADGNGFMTFNLPGSQGSFQLAVTRSAPLSSISRKRTSSPMPPAWRTCRTPPSLPALPAAPSSWACTP